MVENNCPIDVTPLDQSEPIENENIISLNYTNQDFWSMKSRLVDFIRTRFTTNYSDFVESDMAIMLIELYAFIADTLAFKTDQTANEIFIDTVTEIENAFRLSNLVGFEPTPPIAARSLWSATVNTPLTTDLIISAPVATSAGALTIEVFPADSNNNPIFDESIVITAGNLVNNSLVGVEGSTIVDTFSGSGEASQTVTMAQTPVLFDSIRVKVDGTTWKNVDFFTDSSSRREYRVEFDSDYQAFVIFGNNRAGLLPSNGSVIEVTYRTGGGVAGNIVTGFIETQRTFSVANIPFKVPVTFRNFTRGEFGYDGDGIEDIRRKLPQYLQTQDRAVTGSDYKTLADHFATPYQGQVGKSTAVLRNHGCAANVIDLYILALSESNDTTVNSIDLQEATDELKAALQAEIDSKKMLTDHVCIRDGEIILTDVLLDVTTDRLNRGKEEELRERVLRRIDSFFRLTEWEYGDDLKEADIVKVLSDVREARSVDATFTTDDTANSGDMVAARYFEIIRPDDITINFTFE